MSRTEPLPPRLTQRLADRRAHTRTLIDELSHAYPNAHCALTFQSPWQLLVATILSAQCTDARVNLVTPALFTRFPDADTLADADPGDVEKIIQPTGYFRSKTRHVIGAAQRVVDAFDGTLPHTMADLLTIPGVARKTANVVLANCFPDQVDGIAVDTHVQRITRRLGLTRELSPVAIERDLVRIVDRADWGLLTHLLIDLGRDVCRAPVPHCDHCPVAGLCPSRKRFTIVADCPSAKVRR